MTTETEEVTGKCCRCGEVGLFVDGPIKVCEPCAVAKAATYCIGYENHECHIVKYRVSEKQGAITVIGKSELEEYRKLDCFEIIASFRIGQ